MFIKIKFQFIHTNLEITNVTNRVNSLTSIAMNLGGSIRINKCAVFFVIALVVLLIYIFAPSFSSIGNLPKSHDKVNLRKLVIGLILAASSGGKEVIKISKELDFGIESKGKTKEGIEEPVTRADQNSHCSIAYGLRRIFPNLGLISEEDVLKKNCPQQDDFFDLDPSVLASVKLPDEYVDLNDVTVWIDPLDATKEYTEKLFHFVSVMICVAVKGDPVIGVVHFPFNKKTYWAWKGQGVSDTLSKVKADHDHVKSPIVVVSRSHAGEVKELAKKMFGDKVSIINAAGSGYKIIQVLEGNATIYLHNTHIKKWDLCAGNALVNALGGTMKTLIGKDISYSADSPHVVDDGLMVELNKNVIIN